MQNIYQTRVKKFSGTDDKEVYVKARSFYLVLTKKTRRRPYVRSAYFGKEKIFIDTFWQHMHQKNRRDRNRRMRYLPCAIELIQNSRYSPITVQNPNRYQELLHRFVGMTSNHELFYVQIKEHKRNKQKSLMSIFPV